MGVIPISGFFESDQGVAGFLSAMGLKPSTLQALEMSIGAEQQ